MKYAFEENIGYEKILGTNRPVMAVAYGSGTKWVSGALCNGTMTKVEHHKRRYEAVAAAEALTMAPVLDTCTYGYTSDEIMEAFDKAFVDLAAERKAAQ